MAKSKHVLVTGASGFIGSHLVANLLAQGLKVSLLVREQSKLSDLPFDMKLIHAVCHYDENITHLIAEFKQIKPDIVIHLASLFIAEHKPEDVSDLVAANIHFSTLLLEAMRVTGVKKLINTGTYWQHFSGDPSYNPACLYAATKQALLDILLFYHNAYQFNAITLELTDSYGPNDPRKKLLYYLNQAARQQTLLKTSQGEQQVSFLHVQDICMAYLRAIDLLDGVGNKPIFESYLLSAKPLTLKELILLFSKVINKNISIEWGARAYRSCEVMTLYPGRCLPGWQPNIELATGLAQVYGKTERG